MIFGMTTFTFVHVVISLVGIGSGFVVVYGLIAGKRLDLWTAVFLLTTAWLTSVTGFSFPFERFMPSHAASGILFAGWCWRWRFTHATKRYSGRGLAPLTYVISARDRPLFQASSSCDAL